MIQQTSNYQSFFKNKDIRVIGFVLQVCKIDRIRLSPVSLARKAGVEDRRQLGASWGLQF